MSTENEILIKENEIPIKESEDEGTLLKKKTKKDPNAPKKQLTEGQKKALTLMNDARTKKKEEKLKKEYEKIMEREQSQPKPQQQPQQTQQEEYEESSEEEVTIIKKSKTEKPKKKKKKIIVIESDSDDSEYETNEPEYPPTPTYKSRDMKSQQNRRSVIQQHNEKQTQKNFFCN